MLLPQLLLQREVDYVHGRTRSRNRMSSVLNGVLAASPKLGHELDDVRKTDDGRYVRERKL